MIAREQEQDVHAIEVETVEEELYYTPMGDTPLSKQPYAMPVDPKDADLAPHLKERQSGEPNPNDEVYQQATHHAQSNGRRAISQPDGR